MHNAVITMQQNDYHNRAGDGFIETPTPSVKQIVPLQSQSTMQLQTCTFIQSIHIFLFRKDIKLFMFSVECTNVLSFYKKKILLLFLKFLERMLRGWDK